MKQHWPVITYSDWHETCSFLERVKTVIAGVGGTPTIHGKPGEIPDAIPFAEDSERRPYDAEAAARYHQALLRVDRVFRQFVRPFSAR